LVVNLITNLSLWWWSNGSWLFRLILFSERLSPQSILRIVDLSSSLGIECSSDWTWESHNRFVLIRSIRHSVGTDIENVDTLGLIINGFIALDFANFDCLGRGKQQ
jgi:hypothetical protein